MSVANFKGISDISIIHNNTLMMEDKKDNFRSGVHCLILCAQKLGLKIKH